MVHVSVNLDMSLTVAKYLHVFVATYYLEAPVNVIPCFINKQVMDNT